MLILTRKYGETLLIGPDVKITVVEIDHRQGRVRLGIEAPRDVAIIRPDAKNKLRQDAVAALGDVAGQDAR